MINYMTFKTGSKTVITLPHPSSKLTAIIISTQSDKWTDAAMKVK
jgi:hypothetical protein